MSPRTAVRPLTLAGLALALAAALSPAQEKAAAPSGAAAWRIDPAHSSVEFKVRHLMGRVPGRFQAFSGSFTFDPANLAATSVEVEIDAASISTNHERRDGHLKSADFFEVEKFPKITFQSTSVKPVDASHARLLGNLTIKGITKPVTLDVEILGVGKGGRGEERAAFEARGKIDRTAYNVMWNRALEGGGTLLGDEVEIMLGVEAVKEGTESTAGKS